MSKDKFKILHAENHTFFFAKWVSCWRMLIFQVHFDFHEVSLVDSCKRQVWHVEMNPDRSLHPCRSYFCDFPDIVAVIYSLIGHVQLFCNGPLFWMLILFELRPVTNSVIFPCVSRCRSRTHQEICIRSPDCNNSIRRPLFSPYFSPDFCFLDPFLQDQGMIFA